jgi:hypothetical protein
MQTSYDINTDEAYAGLKVDSRFDTVESKLAQGSIGFGLGVMSGQDAVNQVRDPALNKTILSQSTDLVALNSTIVTVNGVAHSAVVFATSDVLTMAAIAAEIATDDAVLSATYPGSGDDITVIGANGQAISVTAVTTLGAGQPTWSQVQSDQGVFRGISLHKHVEKDANGVAQYVDKAGVDVVRKGLVWMPHVAAATPAVDDTLYINLAIAAEAGKATDVSSGNITTGGKIREVNSTLKLVKAEINLP